MTSTYSNDQLEAIQAAVDRVSSYQDGAPEGTVEKELRDALSEAGVDVADDEVKKLADAIEDEHGAIRAADVLA